MKRYGLFSCTLVLAMTGCAGGTPTLSVNPLERIQELDRFGSTPTVAQYEVARGQFLAGMHGILDQQNRALGSRARTVRNLIAFTGGTLGLGGTVASFLVDDDGDKATLAQASASVAGVSGIVGLLPIGSVRPGTAGVKRYLEHRLPRFERRWPESLEEPLDQGQWEQFVADSTGMREVVDQLLQ